MLRSRLAGAQIYAAIAAISTLAALQALAAPAPDIEWRHYSGDYTSAKYSTAEQIDKSNFKNLKVAWRWSDTEANGTREAQSFRSTPLVVHGKMYVITGLNIVACIDPGTGKTLWTHDPKAYDYPAGAHAFLLSRGVEYWEQGDDRRIILATSGLQLMELNADTGKVIETFGEEGGWTDLSKNVARTGELKRQNYNLNSPPVVCRDTIVVGCVVNDQSSSQDMPPGDVRGYDVRTGKLKWKFNTIPHPGEFGNETWENNSWEINGNTNVWSMMSVDEELGYVYMPVSTPTNDYYGGNRHGNDLFAESLVCIDGETGKRVWHFQGVHHGIWDYDFPCAPNLVEITVNGQKIKAVAQASKQGFTYVFDRVSGKPVWPIEERPVPQSKVPGEKTSPTQPFPTKPPAFETQGVTTDTVNNLTPEIKAEALALIAGYEVGPLFTPVITPGLGGKRNLIFAPGNVGGANWQGVGADPETGIIYIQSITRPSGMTVNRGRAGSGLEYTGGGGSAPGPRGLPLLKPPWGRITAIDLNKGEFAWQVPLGDSYRNHPALAGVALPERLGSSLTTGLAGQGLCVTKTLVISNQTAERDPAPLPQAATRGPVPSPTPAGGSVNSAEPVPAPVAAETAAAAPAAVAPRGRAGARDGATSPTAGGRRGGGRRGSPPPAAGPEAAPARGPAPAPPAVNGWLRAFDKATGAMIAEIKFDNGPTSPAMTYVHNGKQYVAFAAAGAGRPRELIAFALPD